jgi:hypothetical protein
MARMTITATPPQHYLAGLSLLHRGLAYGHYYPVLSWSHVVTKRAAKPGRRRGYYFD